MQLDRKSVTTKSTKCSLFTYLEYKQYPVNTTYNNKSREIVGQDQAWGFIDSSLSVTM